MSYDDGKHTSQISTFVHEILHVLYFPPKLFQDFLPNSEGKPFLYENDDKIGYIQGNNIVREAREHYDCFSINKGIFLLNKFDSIIFLTLQFNLRTEESRDHLELTSENRVTETRSWSRTTLWCQLCPE